MRMDITSYVEALRRDLLAGARSGGDDVAAAAERLTLTLEPATRLALMEALSHAAAEITAKMPAGGVEVRLDGRELDFVVEAAPAPPPPPPPAAEEADDANTARITLRLPESVKARAEELAAASGTSLNGWLVQAVRAATRDDGTAVHVDVDLSSIPFLGGGPFGRGPFGGSGRGGRRMTGWV